MNRLKTKTENLMRQRLIEKISDRTKATIKERQKVSLKKLLSKAAQNSTSSRDKFLNTYDALFRLFEIKLADYNFALTNISPHKTLKILLPSFYEFIEKDIRLKPIVDERHKVKKENKNPDNVIFNNLIEIVERILKIEGANVL